MGKRNIERFMPDVDLVWSHFLSLPTPAREIIVARLGMDGGNRAEKLREISKRVGISVDRLSGTYEMWVGRMAYAIDPDIKDSDLTDCISTMQDVLWVGYLRHPGEIVQQEHRGD